MIKTTVGPNEPIQNLFLLELIFFFVIGWLFLAHLLLILVLLIGYSGTNELS